MGAKKPVADPYGKRTYEPDPKAPKKPKKGKR